MRIKSVRVERFKAIEEASFDAESINIFVGSNNSGKSSCIQLLHFGISILQAIQIGDYWKKTKDTSFSRSLVPNELLYSPCSNLYALGTGGDLKENKDLAICLTILLSDSEENDEAVKILVRRGRNGNIIVDIDGVEPAKRISSLEKPFTIYSPGLAGISRDESYISDGALRRRIARGDANLVLRNILQRLSTDEDLWANFNVSLQGIFEKIEVKVDFKQQTDEYISVNIDLGHGLIPVELVGTGVLQAIQILSYVYFFRPSVMILDEPDSHLHPNNQVLMCNILQEVSEDGTQVFLTTHSRHVLDAFGNDASILWAHGGKLEKADRNSDLKILLDLGALNIKEIIDSPQCKVIFLTEDSRTAEIKKIIEASELPSIANGETIIVPYNGCSVASNLAPLIKIIRSQGQNSQRVVVVHRDRDYLTDEEGQSWEKSIDDFGAKPFLTKGVDIESYFINPDHLASLNPDVSVCEFSTMINSVTEDCMEKISTKYFNGRTDILTKNRRLKDQAEMAVQMNAVISANIERYRHGKIVLKALKQKFREEHSQNLNLQGVTSHIRDETLFSIGLQFQSQTAEEVAG